MVAEASADKRLDGMKATMFESPEMETMMTGLVTRMMPVIMKCQASD